MITTTKRTFKALIVLCALMFTTVLYAQDRGYGAAGIFISLNDVSNGFHMNENNWANQYFGGDRLEGMYFGLPTSLVFTHARARAWSHAWNQFPGSAGYGQKCYHLTEAGGGAAFRVFYRLGIGGAFSAWTSFPLASCVHIGGDYLNLFTVHGDVDIDLLAEAYAFGGEGLFTLQMAMTWEFEGDTPPDSLVQTATFRVVHGEVIEPTLAIVKRDSVLPINELASFAISGTDADSVSIYLNNVLLQTFVFPGETFSQTVHFIPTQMGNNFITVWAMNRFGFRIPQEVDFVVTAGSNRRVVTENSRYLQVFPNPATTYLIVQTSDIEVGTDIFIYNVLGRLVGTFQTTSETTIIDVSEFSAGLHILRVGNFIVRWIKN